MNDKVQNFLTVYKESNRILGKHLRGEDYFTKYHYMSTYGVETQQKICTDSDIFPEIYDIRMESIIEMFDDDVDVFGLPIDDCNTIIIGV